MSIALYVTVETVIVSYCDNQRQFNLTPAIWRRSEVRDGTIDFFYHVATTSFLQAVRRLHLAREITLSSRIIVIDALISSQVSYGRIFKSTKREMC